MDNKKLLCIGRGRLIIKPLVKKLQQAGYDAVGTTSIIHAIQLVRSQPFYAIGFGRAITKDEKNSVVDEARKLNPGIFSFTGRFPSVPLLVQQVNYEMYRHSGIQKAISGINVRSINSLNIQFTLPDDCHLTFKLLHVSPLFITKEHELSTQYFTTGSHTVILEHDVLKRRGNKFFIITYFGHVVHLQNV